MRKKRVRGLALALFLLLWTVLQSNGAFPGGQATAEGCASVYFPNWNVYSDSAAQVKNLPWNYLDCIYHAFWKIEEQNGTYSIVSTDPWADTDPTNGKAHFPQYAAMAKKHPQVDILLSIGGWTCSGQFSAMCLTEKSRASFIDSCMKTLEAHPFFSGLDLDWEYPGIARSGGKKDEGNPVKGDDKTNYTRLLRELRASLDLRFGKGKKRLTVCAPASPNLLAHQDYAALHPFVDRINVMTYDMTGLSSSQTGHHSPLYGADSAHTAVDYLKKLGVPAGKIAIGSPLYSHGWKMSAGEGQVLGAKAKGFSGGTRLWKKVDPLEQSALPVGTPGWHAGYDEEAQAAYLWNDDPTSSDFRVFLTYENARSLDAKLSYIHQQGLSGLIVWQSGGDDAAQGFPMLRRIHRALHP